MAALLIPDGLTFTLSACALPRRGDVRGRCTGLAAFTIPVGEFGVRDRAESLNAIPLSLFSTASVNHRNPVLLHCSFELGAFDSAESAGQGSGWRRIGVPIRGDMSMHTICGPVVCSRGKKGSW